MSQPITWAPRALSVDLVRTWRVIRCFLVPPKYATPYLPNSGASAHQSLLYCIKHVLTQRPSLSFCIHVFFLFLLPVVPVPIIFSIACHSSFYSLLHTHLFLLNFFLGDFHLSSLNILFLIYVWLCVILSVCLSVCLSVIVCFMVAFYHFTLYSTL